MADIVGEAIIKLKADIKELQKGLKQAEKDSATTGEKIAGAIGTGAGIAAGTIASAAVAITAAVTKQSVEFYGAYEQAIGGVETLFKDASDTVIANSERAYMSAGVSATTYLEQVTSLAGALMQSTGEDAEEAAKLADRAMSSIADNSAKIGTDITMLQNAYQSLARGQFMLLDNLKLGYGGTRGEMERLIKDASQMTDEMQKLGVTVDATSMDFGNMVNAIAVVQEHMGIAGTTEAEAISTIQGSMKAFKAAKDDLIRGLSDPTADLDKLLDNLLNTAVNIGTNLGKTILRALPKVADAIEKLVAALAVMLPQIIPEIIPAFTEAVMNIASTLIEAAPAIFDMLIKAIAGLISSISAALPRLLTSIVKAIMGIVQVLLDPENLKLIFMAGVDLLMGLVKALPEILRAFNEAMPGIMQSLVAILTDPEFIQMWFEASVQIFMALVEAVPAILGPLAEAWLQIIGDLWQKIKDGFTGFAANFAAGLGNAIIHGLNKMIEFVEQSINGPIDAINFALEQINTIPGVNISTLSRIQFDRIPEVAMATGGIVTRPTTALIGEAGPEAVIPLQDNTNWAKAIAGALNEELLSDELSGGRTVNIYMTNQINNKLDIDEISRELVTSIRRAI